MTARFNLVPDIRFEPLQPGLRERVRSAANALDAQSFPSVLDSTMRGVLAAAFNAAGAHEGTLWLAERGESSGASVSALVPVYNTGPNASRFVGNFRQPIGKGLISTVLLYEQPFCENNVHANQNQDKTLDQTLGVVTSAMIAVPLYFAGTPRGVISCVQLTSSGAPAATVQDGFSMEALAQVQLASEVLSRLLDHWLVGVTVGWRPE
jgi:hypothetical protein